MDAHGGSCLPSLQKNKQIKDALNIYRLTYGDPHVIK